MVMVNIDLVGVVTTVTAFITLAFLVNNFWNNIVGWLSTLTGKEIDLDRLPANSKLKKEFNDINSTLSKIDNKLSELSKVQENTTNKMRGDILELKLMRGVDHSLPPQQILEWYNEYKQLGRNGSMDFIIADHIHPEAFDYYKKMQKEMKRELKK